MNIQCPQCMQFVAHDTHQCACGFRLRELSDDELYRWFERVRQTLEDGYLQAATPWEQSGKSGSFEDWVRLRVPIAECITEPGSFLDVGCANGFLLECLLDWTAAKGLRVAPYGLDISPRIAALARVRLPEYRDNLFVGNAWTWTPSHRFDYVRTEIVYVPPDLHAAFVRRLLDEFVADDGVLLVAQYRSRREDLTTGWIDGYLKMLGFSVSSYTSGFNGRGRELTRVAVIRRTEQGNQFHAPR